MLGRTVSAISLMGFLAAVASAEEPKSTGEISECGVLTSDLPRVWPIEWDTEDGAVTSTAVNVPAGNELIFVGPSTPDVANPAAKARTVARYGNTETQMRSAIEKLRNSDGSLVTLRVYLVAPPGQKRMDQRGMMRAYRRFIRSLSYHRPPILSVVQVVALENPGWLVQIEAVTASRVIRGGDVADFCLDRMKRGLPPGTLPPRTEDEIPVSSEGDNAM